MACNCGYRKRIIEAKLNYQPKRSIYLDYNATTPVDPQVLGTIDNLCRREWANPSSMHTAGVHAYNEIEKHRENIANYFNVDPAGIHFCKNGTEAIHQALFGLSLREKSRTIITTAIEHSAITHPIKHIKKSGRKVKTLNIDKNGIMDIDSLKKIISKNDSVLIYSPVNHETGSIQPVKEIFKIAKRYNCIIIIDGVQSAARMKISEWVQYCDMFTVSGHKIYAPKGIAFLYKDKNIRVRATTFGGYQENGLFPGTENTPGIAALSEAVSILKEKINIELKELSILTEEGLSILNEKGIDFNLESPENRVPGVICLSFPWIKDIEKVLYHLNEKEIYLSRFSACTPYINGRSKILTAMGRNEKRAKSSVRISLGRWSKRDDFFRLAKALKECMEIDC